MDDALENRLWARAVQRQHEAEINRSFNTMPTLGGTPAAGSTSFHPSNAIYTSNHETAPSIESSSSAAPPNALAHNAIPSKDEDYFDLFIDPAKYYVDPADIHIDHAIDNDDHRNDLTSVPSPSLIPSSSAAPAYQNDHPLDCQASAEPPAANFPSAPLATQPQPHAADQQQAQIMAAVNSAYSKSNSNPKTIRHQYIPPPQTVQAQHDGRIARLFPSPDELFALSYEDFVSRYGPLEQKEVVGCVLNNCVRLAKARTLLDGDRSVTSDGWAALNRAYEAILWFATVVE